MEDKSIFSKVEEKTNVKKEDIIKLAKQASNQDLSDEKNIRKLIKEVAKLAGKDVSKEKEERFSTRSKKTDSERSENVL